MRVLVGVWLLAVGVIVSAAAPEVADPVASVLATQGVALPLTPPATDPDDRLNALNCLRREPRQGDSLDRVWSGLVAARCGNQDTARRYLAVPDPSLGDLEHWRFIVHAEAALAAGIDPGLEQSWAARPRWVHDELELVWAGFLAERDVDRFWDFYQPYLAHPQRPANAELEELAWSLTETGDPRRGPVALRMLVHAPVQASVLEVVDSLRDDDGVIDWYQTFGPKLLRLRAENLLEAGIPAGALSALEDFPPAARDLDWQLLNARALTLDRRGSEAWASLAGVVGQTNEDDLALAWRRAEAALDASQARRGRTNLSSQDRAVMRARGHQQLDLIATRAPDDRQRADALRRRVADLNNDDSAAEVSALVAALAELDPEDRSAERWLWGQGWKQYQTRNWTGAIGWWRQLLDIYPQGNRSEQARYWAGRAHSRLGNVDRAQELWRQVATSPIDHYYARRARERLTAPVDASGQRFADQPPPKEARLTLAAWLVDAGLPELAARELRRQALEHLTDGDHVLAARIDSDLGERRQAIHSIRRAYPQLGTPQEVLVPMFAHELYYPRAFEQEVKRNAALSRLDPPLVWGIIRQESAFDPQARSRSGARGLMQLMPPTGREQAGKLGLRYSLSSLHEPDYNLRLGTSYFRRVLDMFDGNLELALAGYNSGPYRLRRMVNAEGHRLQLDEFIERLPWAETRSYVRRIVQFQDSFATLYPDAASDT